MLNDSNKNLEKSSAYDQNNNDFKTVIKYKPWKWVNGEWVKETFEKSNSSEVQND